MRVVICGVCVAGKTTLVSRLRELGVEAYNVAQEHSGVSTLWRKKCPDVLVMLDVTLPVIRTRRDVPWGEERLVVQRERLRDARVHADLYIQTDPLSREEVVEQVLAHLKGRNDHVSNHCSQSETRP
ncbi:MAG: hypothetical protein P4N41_25045 [Negativicutes bacterium]|nr:hypothetical protein [Negativicutes bacterium]